MKNCIAATLKNAVTSVTAVTSLICKVILCYRKFISTVTPVTKRLAVTAFCYRCYRTKTGAVTLKTILNQVCYRCYRRYRKKSMPATAKKVVVDEFA